MLGSAYSGVRAITPSLMLSEHGPGEPESGRRAYSSNASGITETTTLRAAIGSSGVRDQNTDRRVGERPRGPVHRAPYRLGRLLSELLASLVIMAGSDHNHRPQSLTCGRSGQRYPEPEGTAPSSWEGRRPRQPATMLGCPGVPARRSPAAPLDVRWRRRKQPGTEENGRHGKFQHGCAPRIRGGSVCRAVRLAIPLNGRVDPLK